eukprot:scaffold16985_cov102-Isochrysis_galbana.AAC.1
MGVKRGKGGGWWRAKGEGKGTGVDAWMGHWRECSFRNTRGLKDGHVPSGGDNGNGNPRERRL